MAPLHDSHLSLILVSSAFLCFFKFNSSPFHICFIKKSCQLTRTRVQARPGLCPDPFHPPSTLYSINKNEKCLQNVARPLFLTDFFLYYASAQEPPTKKAHLIVLPLYSGRPPLTNNIPPIPPIEL